MGRCLDHAGPYRNEDAGELDDHEQRGAQQEGSGRGLHVSGTAGRWLCCPGWQRWDNPAPEPERHQGHGAAPGRRIADRGSTRQGTAASATAKIGGTTYLFASNGRGGTTAWTFGADHQLKEAWKSKVGGNSPFYAGGLLYIYDPAPRGAKLHIFDAVSGNPVADLDSGGGHWNSPIVADNRIAMPEGAISGFGFAGGRRPGAPGAPAAATPPPPPPPPLTSVPTGIVDIWRLP
jgi:hypothetical protein